MRFAGHFSEFHFLPYELSCRSEASRPSDPVTVAAAFYPLRSPLFMHCIISLSYKAVLPPRCLLGLGSVSSPFLDKISTSRAEKWGCIAWGFDDVSEFCKRALHCERPAHSYGESAQDQRMNWTLCTRRALLRHVYKHTRVAYNASMELYLPNS